MEDILINGKRQNVCRDRPGGVCDAIVDSGSSLLTGPRGDMEPLLGQLKVDGKCANVGKMPTVSVLIKGEEGSVAQEVENAVVCCSREKFQANILLKPPYATLHSTYFSPPKASRTR